MLSVQGAIVVSNPAKQIALHMLEEFALLIGRVQLFQCAARCLKSFIVEISVELTTIVKLNVDGLCVGKLEGDHCECVLSVVPIARFNGLNLAILPIFQVLVGCSL